MIQLFLRDGVDASDYCVHEILDFFSKPISADIGGLFRVRLRKLNSGENDVTCHIMK